MRVGEKLAEGATAAPGSAPGARGGAGVAGKSCPDREAELTAVIVSRR